MEQQTGSKVGKEYVKAVYCHPPGGLVSKESTCNARNLSLISGLGRPPGEGHDKPTAVFLPGESPWTEELGGL